MQGVDRRCLSLCRNGDVEFRRPPAFAVTLDESYRAELERQCAQTEKVFLDDLTRRDERYVWPVEDLARRPRRGQRIAVDIIAVTGDHAIRHLLASARDASLNIPDTDVRVLVVSEGGVVGQGQASQEIARYAARRDCSLEVRKLRSPAQVIGHAFGYGDAAGMGETHLVRIALNVAPDVDGHFGRHPTYRTYCRGDAGHDEVFFFWNAWFRSFWAQAQPLFRIPEAAPATRARA
jgi:hypothetical protein